MPCQQYQGNSMKYSDLLFDAGRPVAYLPGLVKHLGSINATIFFAQLFYWTDKEHSALGIYKTADEFQEETGMTPYEQTNARKMLVSKGVLIETHRRLEHRIYYKLNLERLNEIVEESLKQDHLANSTDAKPSFLVSDLANLQLPNLRNQDSGNLETRIRESKKPGFDKSTETTSETTSESGATAPARRAAAEGLGSRTPQPTVVQAALEATPTAFTAEAPLVKNKSVDFLVARGVEYQVAVDWMVTRKAKPVTPTIWSIIVDEAKIAGITPVEAVTWSAGRSRMNFEASWYLDAQAKASAPAGYTKFPAKPNLMDENRAAAAAYLAERKAKMGQVDVKDMGEIEQVSMKQNDFFGDNWEPA
jgi:hypothetical protein